MSLSQYLRESFLASWYGKTGSTCWTRGLQPLAWLFSVLADYRKTRILESVRWQPPVPVIVVGNITVGGTGKTPVVAALVEYFRQRGYLPGVVSRGYRGCSYNGSLMVNPETDPLVAGDEPVMLSRQLKVPVVVNPDRVQAAQFLCRNADCDLIISDDGLQHYQLHRHVELLIVDGQRLLGNGLCLPAGPLREPVERIDTVDMVLINYGVATNSDKSYLASTAGSHGNTHFFVLKPGKPQAMVLGSGSDLKPGRVHAVAAIGNPERFFQTLRSLRFEVIPHVFADHYVFKDKDIFFEDSLPVVMTSKDAVKCTAFVDDRHWYLPVSAEFSFGVLDSIATLVEHYI